MYRLERRRETARPRRTGDRSKSVRGVCSAAIECIRSATVLGACPAVIRDIWPAAIYTICSAKAWSVRFNTAAGLLFRAPRNARPTSPMAFGAAWLLALCLLVGSGCSADKRQVEEVALQFVEGIAQQDPQILDVAVDWEKYFSGAADEDEPGAADRRLRRPGGERRALEPSGPAPGTPDLVEQQKNALLSLLTSDRGLAISYLTADHSIEKTTIEGTEARVEVLQKDRATGEASRLTFKLYKHPEKGWKIYKFQADELE